MLEVKPFLPEHVLAIEPREPDKTIAASVDSLNMAKAYVERGPAWTGFWEGTPMFCAGIIMLWPGVGEGWALTTELVERYPLSFHRAASQGIDKAMIDHKIHRLQIAIPETHHVSRHWAARLKFHAEAAMKQYGADRSDWIRYVRFS